MKRGKRKIKFGTWLLCAAALIVLFLASSVLKPYAETWLAGQSAQTPPPLNADAPLDVYFLDVGQADSILIRQGAFSALIDAGTNQTASALVNTLRSLGVDHLSVVVGTHPHSDHIGGLAAVIDAFPIDTLIMPKVEHDTKTFRDVLDAAEKANLRITSPKAGTKYAVGAAELTVLYDGIDKDNLNNCSVVTRLTYGPRSLLLMGDAETPVEDNLLTSGRTLRSDFLKVGHHGSNTSSGRAFLEAVRPLDAFILCGVDNSYHHPHSTTLAKLDELGVNVYRTDLLGTLRLRVEPDGMYEVDAWEGE